MDAFCSKQDVTDVTTILLQVGPIKEGKHITWLTDFILQ